MMHRGRLLFLVGCCVVLMLQAIPSGAPLITYEKTQVDRREVRVGQAVRLQVTVETEQGDAVPEAEFPKLPDGVAFSAENRIHSVNPDNGKNAVVYSYLFSFANPGQAEIPSIVFRIGKTATSSKNVPITVTSWMNRALIPSLVIPGNSDLNMAAGLVSVHFRPGSYELEPREREILVYAAQILKFNSTMKVLLKGHTDDREGAKNSFDLGEKRVREVREFLVGQGASRGQLDVITSGRGSPVAAGKDDEARARNNRVSFEIKNLRGDFAKPGTDSPLSCLYTGQKSACILVPAVFVGRYGEVVTRVERDELALGQKGSIEIIVMPNERMPLEEKIPEMPPGMTLHATGRNTSSNYTTYSYAVFFEKPGLYYLPPIEFVDSGQSGISFQSHRIVFTVGGIARPDVAAPAPPSAAAKPQPAKPLVPPRLSAQIAFVEPSGNDALDAEEKASLRLTLANAGPGAALGVQLALDIKGADGIRLLEQPGVGDLAAGKTVVREIVLEASETLAPGKAKITVKIKEANGFDAPPLAVEFETRALKAPKLVLAGVSIGGLGVVKTGEIASVAVMVSNAGMGAAQGATASLAVGSADIFVSGESLVSLGTLEPGQTKTVEFQFVVNNRFKGKALPVSVTLAESRGKYGTEAPLGLALGQSAPEIKVVSVSGKAEAEAPQVAPEVENVDVPPASKIAPDPEAFAVVIGIEKYRQEGIPKVDFAARDAKTVQAYLTVAMGFPEENVILLQNDHAAKTDLEKYLGKWLKNQVSDKSRVFIYYAGHGAPNPATGEGYLIPYDGDPNYTEETAYPIKKLYETLAKLPARAVTVTLDACFSGQGERSLLAKGARPLVNVVSEPHAAGENTVVIAAAQGNQISTSYPDGRHGLLTYYLLKGLRGEADSDRDGQVTTAELFGYIKPSISRQARRQNVEQVPTLHPAPERLGARSGEAWTRIR